jgi:hypothetical protein
MFQLSAIGASYELRHLVYLDKGHVPILKPVIVHGGLPLVNHMATIINHKRDASYLKGFESLSRTLRATVGVSQLNTEVFVDDVRVKYNPH